MAIATIDPESGVWKRLTENSDSFAVSPDGQTIFYSNDIHRIHVLSQQVLDRKSIHFLWQPLWISVGWTCPCQSGSFFNLQARQHTLEFANACVGDLRGFEVEKSQTGQLLQVP